MFTVVIPTMWKSESIEDLLISISDIDNISEIILINNDKENTPNFKILKHKKIIHITPYKNIITNRSLNLGVLLSKNNNICLLNDDILFDTNLFNFMENHKDKNLCGLSMFSEDTELKLIECDEKPFGFGSIMFIRKDSYQYIPHQLLLQYGDDYLYLMNEYNGNINYKIVGCKNNNIFAVTSDAGIYVEEYEKNIIDKENEFFNLEKEKKIGIEYSVKIEDPFIFKELSD